MKRTATLLLCTFTGLSGTAWAVDPFTISVTQRNSLNLSTYGRPPIVATGSQRLVNSVEGAERNQCRADKEGRVSNAAGEADVVVTGQRSDGLTLELTGNSSALGGHYRNCVQCVLNQCVGILPQDTSATALSRAGATVAFQFANNIDEAPYILDVGVANRGAAASLTIVDATGNPVGSGSNAGSYAIHARPGAVFYVNVHLETNVRNNGGGGSDTSTGHSRVDLSMRRAPLIAANQGYEPFIKGGRQTSAYPNVGAILIKGQLHCTATVAGQRTLLTAAHCIHGYESQLKDFTFMVGSNIVQPTFGPVQITGFAYPDGSDKRYKFERSTLQDDIAVLYLASDATAQAVELHTGEPTWDRVLSDKTNLVFVGFGYDVVQGAQVAPNIKREAAWYINAVENRRVLFSVPKTNTCKGDSGGPAFLVENGKIIQVAITSGGQSDCSSGFETRIDAFLPWLAGRIR